MPEDHGLGPIRVGDDLARDVRGSSEEILLLLYAEQGWRPVWLAFSGYAVALIAARLVFGHLPDRLGGARVALWLSTCGRTTASCGEVR